MAAVSASAAATSSSPPWLDLLGNFTDLIVEKEYEKAEKLLNGSELRQMLSGESGNQLLEKLLEKNKFLIILELVKMLSKHELSNKYCEFCQVIAMTWLGDPAGYFILQELIPKAGYETFAKSIKLGYEHDPEKSELHSFFEDLWQDIEFVSKNPLLFAVLKKLQTGELEVTDISSLVEADGSDAALQDCLQFFVEYMGPHQMGHLCQCLSDQISYFREHGTLIPKPDLGD